MSNNNQLIIKDTSVPVVVLRLKHHLSVDLLRSLGRLGINVFGIDTNTWSPGLNSLYCRKKFIFDIDDSSSEATVQFLLDVGRKIGKRSLLYSTNDETSILLAEHAEILSEYYSFHQLHHQLARKLVNKKEMYFLAKQHSIPTAETTFPQSRQDVENYITQASFPIMLKAIDGDISARRSGKKMFITNSKRELLNLYDQFENHSDPNFMLQEYIPGGEDTVWMFNGYFNKNSDCLFAITGKKIRLAPVYTGYTSLGVCLKNDSVEETTKRFMKEIGYKGILDIGYRYDFRDGKYKVLDINPRIGATFRLFVGENGLDVARAQYLDLTGQEVPESKIVEGRKWLVEDRDLISSIRYYRDKKLTIREWIRSFRGVQEVAWFAVDDLLPFFLMCLGNIKKILFPFSHRR